MNMRGSNGIEALLNDGAGEFGFVAVAAEVAEVNMLKIGGNEFSKDGGGGFVAEMAVATHDALFDAPRTAEVILQQLHIVVGFENQDVGSADSLHNELGGVPEVGEETDATAVGAEHEADGIVGIVRDGKCFHRDFAEIEGCAGVEEAEIEAGVFELEFDRFLGEAIAVNGDGQFVAERAEAVGVVGMFVREENAAETFGRATDLGEAFADLFRAETGIDQETRAAGFEIGAIAVGTAAENRELNRD